MKILHTSDWHIGRSLCERNRYKEFQQFLAWLTETIQSRQIDVLLVAGDIFDTSTPSNRSQALYYQFLCRVALSHCRHIVIIAGNHDSPTFLNAPKELLRTLNVHIVASITENPEQEVLLLKDQLDKPELIVCAVPYLRDRDIRKVDAGESIATKEQKLVDGIRQHYAQVCELAAQKRQKLNREIPIIAMGHLFTAGGKTIDNDGVRDLYVGSLAHVTSGIFPDCIDYLALGHLHVPQKINQSELMRYSGSPIPMGFGEAQQEKSVCLVEIINSKVNVSLIVVPTFQQLESIRGNWDEINQRIQDLSICQSQAWLEIIYEGEELIDDLGARLEAVISESKMEIIRVKNKRITDQVLNKININETLENLDETIVFKRCLNAHEVSEEQQKELLHSYREILTSLQNEEPFAE